VSEPVHLGGGVEWVVDAFGCDPARLRSASPMKELFARAIADLGLKPVAEPLWHEFGGEGGASGLVLFAESHLACHTFPEERYASLNLYCCQPRPEWDFALRLRESLGAERVEVRRIARGHGGAR